ncbi:IS3 family transposase, partial [Klebsiella pneumoniae]|uniref:IS3 family transposase n=1 Tax=Klebsiella pneumoniae TaxID=573 RepID=UPI00272F339D
FRGILWFSHKTAPYSVGCPTFGVQSNSTKPLLKRERIKKKIYGTREEARSDIFDYIEMFYNSKRRHGSSEQMSPTEYENQYYQRLGSV